MELPFGCFDRTHVQRATAPHTVQHGAQQGAAALCAVQCGAGRYNALQCCVQCSAWHLGAQLAALWRHAQVFWSTISRCRQTQRSCFMSWSLSCFLCVCHGIIVPPRASQNPWYHQHRCIVFHLLDIRGMATMPYLLAEHRLIGGAWRAGV